MTMTYVTNAIRYAMHLCIHCKLHSLSRRYFRERGGVVGVGSRHGTYGLVTYYMVTFGTVGSMPSGWESFRAGYLCCRG